jgi:hypothetical protein
MPTRLRMIVTQEEDLTLRKLRLDQTVLQRTRGRAHILRLKAQGLNSMTLLKL